MKQITGDILIVGAGLTGLLAAYSLSLMGYKIILIEKNKILKSNNIETQNDTRTTAISEGSRIFFEKINLWKMFSQYAEPIKNIDVIDRSLKTKIEFCNNSTGNNLGYIVKNLDIIKILVQLLSKSKNVFFIEGLKLNSVNFLTDGIQGCFNSLYAKADLLIAADGKKSAVRKMLKTPVYEKTYKEKALVINFTHSNNHNNKAYEYFFKNGPLAILPMQKINKSFQSSLIWSNDPKYLKILTEIKEENLKKTLNEKIYNAVGNVEKILSKQIFSLSAHINAKFYEDNIIYLGDSAHSFHPIAGQGWNLSVRDLKKLYELIKNTKKAGLKIGSKDFCMKYNHKCYYECVRLYHITDKLNFLFKLDGFIPSSFRSIGFEIIQKNKKLKKFISNFAMGLS